MHRIDQEQPRVVEERDDFYGGRFTEVYLKSVEDVFRFWTPSMQEEIARHCFPWRQGVTDFKQYLLASEPRYAIACKSLCRSGSGTSICDVGGFFGVFCLTLARMGFPVAMTEALQYYSRSFDPIFNFLRDNGIKIIDYDPFDSGAVIDGKFDVVSIMAVLEHYPHSLNTFMSNVTRMLKPDGSMYIEVPNIAFWPKRKAMLAGRTPLVPIGDIYRSAVPFIGHHHEFTFRELQELVELCGFKVAESYRYNYSFRGPVINRLYSDPMLFFMSLIPSMRECMSVLAVRA